MKELRQIFGKKFNLLIFNILLFDKCLNVTF
jgi:hypothetical protein